MSNGLGTTPSDDLNLLSILNLGTYGTPQPPAQRQTTSGLQQARQLDVNVPNAPADVTIPGQPQSSDLSMGGLIQGAASVPLQAAGYLKGFYTPPSLRRRPEGSKQLSSMSVADLQKMNAPRKNKGGMFGALRQFISDNVSIGMNEGTAAGQSFGKFFFGSGEGQAGRSNPANLVYVPDSNQQLFLPGVAGPAARAQVSKDSVKRIIAAGQAEGATALQKEQARNALEAIGAQGTEGANLVQEAIVELDAGIGPEEGGLSATRTAEEDVGVFDEATGLLTGGRRGTSRSDHDTRFMRKADMNRARFGQIGAQEAYEKFGANVAMEGLSRRLSRTADTRKRASIMEEMKMLRSEVAADRGAVEAGRDRAAGIKQEEIKGSALVEAAQAAGLIDARTQKASNLKAALGGLKLGDISKAVEEGTLSQEQAQAMVTLGKDVVNKLTGLV